MGGGGIQEETESEIQEKEFGKGPNEWTGKLKEFESHVERNMEKKSPLKRGREFGSHA